jgi:hypothetical protein
MRKLVAALVLVVGSFSFAQTAQPRPPPEKQIIFGEDDLISGETTKPDVELLQGGAHAAHESLLKPRTEFKEKVLASVHQL